MTDGHPDRQVAVAKTALYALRCAGKKQSTTMVQVTEGAEQVMERHMQ